MPVASSARPLSRIGILVDQRLSREKSNLLTRTINALRRIAEVHLLSGALNEAETLKKLQETSYHLVLAPWYRYLHWNRVEAFFGASRTRGPTFAGYHCDQLDTSDIGPAAEHLRAILLDFGTLTPDESTFLCRALLHDARRSGIQPLLKPTTPIYCENWYAGQGLGSRLDSIFAIPELSGALPWITPSRASALRILLVALWSLIYENGPGKADLSQATSQNVPRAAFQLAADPQALLLRLSFAMPGWTAKSSLAALWPAPGHPATPLQILLRYADFVRLHTLPENPMVELVAGLLPSAASERTHGSIHTLWVEPLSPQLITEPPFELPGPNNPRLLLLPSAASFSPKLRAAAGDSDELRAKDRFLSQATADIRKLRGELADREALIKDLRSGGVSTAPPLPPPDTEALLEAFQERFFEARFQIRQFELQISDLEKRNVSPQEIEELRLKMEALSSRETAWIRKLLKTIQAYKDARKGS